MGHADETTFESFVAATGNQTFRTALLLCGDWHLAEDLTQTTFAKMFAGWPKVRRADNPHAYLRTVLMNTYLSHRRLRRSSETPSATLPDRALPGTDPSTRMALLDGLRSLPHTDRAVLVLRYWEDRSVAQTAQDLGLSEGAVRTRTTRAAQRLRDVLDADFPDVVADRARA
jgi:RNA polymerase sigma-70 factor (sigma-E family)